MPGPSPCTVRDGDIMGLLGKGNAQPRVIGVASGKGGVGKTSIAVT
jgi:Mrp family chromosome partitioning ATPase